MAEEEKKIIVDEDWKTQARREKEQLKAEEQAQKEETQESAERPPLPPADFAGLVSMFATQAFFALGVIKTEQNKETKPDIEMAKFNIDMLGILEEKTKGNLQEQETKVLTDTCQQLRMLFVQVSAGQK